MVSFSTTSKRLIYLQLGLEMADWGDILNDIMVPDAKCSVKDASFSIGVENIWMDLHLLGRKTSQLPHLSVLTRRSSLARGIAKVKSAI